MFDFVKRVVLFVVGVSISFTASSDASPTRRVEIADFVKRNCDNYEAFRKTISEGKNNVFKNEFGEFVVSLLDEGISIELNPADEKPKLTGTIANESIRSTGSYTTILSDGKFTHAALYIELPLEDNPLCIIPKLVHYNLRGYNRAMPLVEINRTISKLVSGGVKPGTDIALGNYLFAIQLRDPRAEGGDAEAWIRRVFDKTVFNGFNPITLNRSATPVNRSNSTRTIDTNSALAEYRARSDIPQPRSPSRSGLVARMQTTIRHAFVRDRDDYYVEPAPRRILSRHSTNTRSLPAFATNTSPSRSHFHS